jgi:tyrosinase
LRGSGKRGILKYSARAAQRENDHKKVFRAAAARARHGGGGEGKAMANGTRIRLGVHNLAPAQVNDLREAHRQLMAIGDNRGYAAKAGIHGMPGYYCWHHQQNDRTMLQMRLFLPWHRAYLYDFEMSLRDRVANVTLPWWDWTLRPPRQAGIPAAYADPPLASSRMDLPNAPQPIRRNTARAPGPAADLPTQADVDAVLAQSDWADFNDNIEDIHDRVHGWVSGDMGVIATAAYDPIFWAHHAMIDRLWWIWQARNGNGNIPSDLLDVVLAPSNFRVRDVLNANALGYDYAAAQSDIPAAGGD